MMQRLLFIDPNGRCSTLISRLRAKSVVCRALSDDPRRMLEKMLESDSALLVACDEMVKTPMIAAASSWMTVFAFEPPLVDETQWITFDKGNTEEEQLEVILGTLLRGDHGRKRTRINIPLNVWIQGIVHPVSNVSLKELWVERWSLPNTQTVFDGVLELPNGRGKIPIRGEVVARRGDGCALHFTPSSDVELLTWLDYFLECLQKTAIHERVEPIKEFFEEP